MKKYYFGEWLNFYHVSWSVRFLIELVITFFLAKSLLYLIKGLGKKFKLKQYWVKGWVWIVKELTYLIGRDHPWAVSIDNRMSDWGKTAMSDNRTRRKSLKKLVVAIGIIIIYFFAVFVDLPFARRLDAYCLNGFVHAKDFFQQWEGILSEGYEEYPELFIKKEPVETMDEDTLEGEREEIQSIYIQLNDRGKGGSNIRQEPNLDAAVVGGVNGNAEIIYQNQCENDGTRYWLKVYLPNEGIEGWLSGRLVDEQQLKYILADEETK